MLRFASRLVNAPGVSTTMATKTTTTTVQMLRLSSAASASVPRSLFPYGLIKFRDIRKRGLFFVDNTHHIRLIEAGYQHFFVRPPRFGKSVFVDTLHRYYDCSTSQNEFDELFGGLDAHTNVTPLVRSFHVLKLDLSTGITGDVQQSFCNNINRALVEFRDHYNLAFEVDETDCHISFKRAAMAVKWTGGKLYVLIDEYDRFANQLLVENIKPYRVGVSVRRSFLQTLKSIGGCQEMRSFITGIMPLALTDSSGYNVARNLTHDSDFASLVGFRERDLERGLALIPHLNMAQREGALTLMRKYYNGYWFKGATEPLYNSTQALYFLDKLSRNKLNVDKLLAMDAASHPALLARLSDTNVKLSNSFVKLARSVPQGERAVAQLLGVSAPLASVALERVIALEDLLVAPTADALQALLFYQGIATFTDAQGSSLRLPNELIRRKQFAPLVRQVQFRDIDLLLREPTAALFEALFADIAKLGPGAVKKESTFAFRVGLVLSKLCRIADIRLEVRAGRTRCDVLLVRKDGALVLELKYVPLDSLMLGGQQLSELTDNEVLRVPTWAQSSHMPASGKSELARKVAHIVLGAQEQVAEQAEALRSSDAASKHGIAAETPLHAWVAVLVGGERLVVRAAADRVVPDNSERAPNMPKRKTRAPSTD
jgi:hypothetical protein